MTKLSSAAFTTTHLSQQQPPQLLSSVREEQTNKNAPYGHLEHSSDDTNHVLPNIPPIATTTPISTATNLALASKSSITLSSLSSLQQQSIDHISSKQARQPSLPAEVGDAYGSYRKSLEGDQSRKYSTPSSIYTISGLTQNEQDYLNREVLSPDKFKHRTMAIPAISSATKGPAESLVSKYKTDIEKREKGKEETRKELEFLRSSLRGSKKLQALEGEPTPSNKDDQDGFYNEAFSPEDEYPGKQFSLKHPPNGHILADDLDLLPYGTSTKHYDNLDIDSILARLNEMLNRIDISPLTTENQGDQARAGSIAQDNNLGFVRDFLNNSRFRESYDIYRTVVTAPNFDQRAFLKATTREGDTADKAIRVSSQTDETDTFIQMFQSYGGIRNLANQITQDPQLSQHAPRPVTSLSEFLRKPTVDNLFMAYDQINQTLSTNGDIAQSQRLVSPNNKDFTDTSTSIQSPTGVPERDAVASSILTPMLDGRPIYNANDYYQQQQQPDNVAMSQYPETANIKVVKIDKGPDPLGATIRNDGDAVVIARIINNGAAQRTGALQEGDELLEINGAKVIGKSVHEVCDILADMNGTLTFVINRPPTTHIMMGGGGSSQAPSPYYGPNYQYGGYDGQVPNAMLNPGDLASMHQYDEPMSVKANFSYDPEEDLYIPCRELGLSFAKGDILHVLNQEDLNWWQAYRDGEDMQGLAGLIPSKNFQIQRETLKRTLFGSEPSSPSGKKLHHPTHSTNKQQHEKVPSEAKRKDFLDSHNIVPNAATTGGSDILTASTSPLHKKDKGGIGKTWTDDLCGRDNLASRLCASAVDYCSPTGAKKKRSRKKDEFDEYECDEILTYEEVELYYPHPDKKRPIVLIGPPDIGRHELRQRLMEEFPDRFAAAVPHTSRPQRFGEIDGQDYHFLSRQTFEADIMAGKFVEHGEFEKALYGTSLSSIRKVIDMGKNCILNLHPQSLKILYHSDLMPYVVFIAPPNIEKLRIIEERRGVFKNDEELAEIIQKAREIEENFGHYFDVFLVNSDLGKTYNQLLEEINRIECEPQWVPKFWLHQYLPPHAAAASPYMLAGGTNPTPSPAQNSDNYSQGITNHAYTNSQDTYQYGAYGQEDFSPLNLNSSHYPISSADYIAFNSHKQNFIS